MGELDYIDHDRIKAIQARDAGDDRGYIYSCGVQFYNEQRGEFYGKEYHYLLTVGQYIEIHEGREVTVETPRGLAVVQIVSQSSALHPLATRPIKDLIKATVTTQEVCDQIKQQGNTEMNYQTPPSPTAHQAPSSTGSMKNKLMDKFFKKIDDVVLDFSTGKMGVKYNGSIFSCQKEGTDFIISENIMESFSTPLPSFAQAVNMDQVKVLDLVVVEGKPKGWITKVNKKSIAIQGLNGTSSNYSPSKVQMLGNSQQVMVVRNIFGDNLEGTQSMLMPLMMMSEEGGDMDKLMPLFLMSQGGGGMGGDASNNMMLPLMMMNQGESGAGGSDSKMLPLMMMMNQGNNAEGAQGNNMMQTMLMMQMMK